MNAQHPNNVTYGYDQIFCCSSVILGKLGTDLHFNSPTSHFNDLYFTLSLCISLNEEL